MVQAMRQMQILGHYCTRIRIRVGGRDWIDGYFLTYTENDFGLVRHQRQEFFYSKGVSVYDLTQLHSLGCRA